MRAIVTGGAGFIGSHVVDELLRRGHEPFVVDNLVSGTRDNLPPDVPFFDVDVCDVQQLERIFADVKPEWVCHQAAQMSVSRSVREPIFDAHVNVIGLLNVFDLAVKHGAQRLVFASSGGVLYGDVFEPADEHHPSNPVSPYGISKWVGEKYLKFYVDEHGVEGVALRYSNVYGPRQNPHGEAGVVAIFAEKMLAAQPSTINGDGKYIRDYVFVDDVARANANAMETTLSNPFTALNIGTAIGKDVNELATSLRDLCAELRNRSGKSEPIPQPGHGEPRAGDLRSSIVSPQYAADVIGWKPSVAFDDGLKRTAEWFANRAFGDSLQS